MNNNASSDRSLQPQAFWSRPVFPLQRSQDIVHVWRFWLNQPDQEIHECLQLLSTNEQRRTASLYTVENRKRFIIARGTLRMILGSYLHTAPTQLEFGYNPHGKPFLRGHEADSHALQFNLTHAHDLGLCAVTASRRVGIDLEWVHDLSHLQPAIHTFLSTREANRIGMLPKSQRLKTFYEMWTRNEAYVKAIGTGVSGTFNLTDPGFTGLHCVKSDDVLWTVVPIEPSLNYVATLVVEGPNVELRYFHFDVSGYLMDQSQPHAYAETVDSQIKAGSIVPTGMNNTLHARA